MKLLERFVRIDIRGTLFAHLSNNAFFGLHRLESQKLY